jgi:hypothetical protein
VAVWSTLPGITVYVVGEFRVFGNVQQWKKLADAPSARRPSRLIERSSPNVRCSLLLQRRKPAPRTTTQKLLVHDKTDGDDEDNSNNDGRRALPANAHLDEPARRCACAPLERLPMRQTPPLHVARAFRCWRLFWATRHSSRVSTECPQVDRAAAVIAMRMTSPELPAIRSSCEARLISDATVLDTAVCQHKRMIRKTRQGRLPRTCFRTCHLQTNKGAGWTRDFH